MEELLEEHYMYNDIILLNKSILSLFKAEHCLYKEYTNTMTPKDGFKKLKTVPCLLYREN